MLINMIIVVFIHPKQFGYIRCNITSFFVDSAGHFIFHELCLPAFCASSAASSLKVQ